MKFSGHNADSMLTNRRTVRTSADLSTRYDLPGSDHISHEIGVVPVAESYDSYRIARKHEPLGFFTIFVLFFTGNTILL